MTRRSELSVGAIVIARVTDPQGGNIKQRRVVVLGQRRLSSGKVEVVIVAMTSTFRPNEPHVVPVPYGPPPFGHPSTRCVKPTAVVCNWVDRIALDDVLEQKGYLTQDALSRTLLGVRKCFPTLLDGNG
jgi:hypothetical protein